MSTGPIITARSDPFDAVYVQSSGGVGVASYHLSADLSQCYISYLNAPQIWRLADDRRPPNKKYFEEVTYDAVQRRFRGSIYWETPFKTKQSTRWEYNFVFSHAFDSIESGSIDEFDKNDEPLGHGGYFGPVQETPKYNLSYTIEPKLEAARALEVLTEKLNLCFHCGAKRTRPITPRCGHTMCRECIIAAVNKEDGACFLCRADIFLVECTDESGGQVHPPLTTPNGQAYVQENQLGLASYHFDGSTPYISYSSAPDNWLFDDGSAFPSKKFFESVKYDEQKREFKGEINWSVATIDGDAKWVYHFRFSDNFTRIGTV